MTCSCRTKLERVDRYIKVLARLEFRKGVDGVQTNDEKQTMSSSFNHSPTRNADGLTAVSQRPNVDPFSEYSSLFPKFSRSYKPCQCCLLVRRCLSRFVPLNTTLTDSCQFAESVSFRAPARVLREPLLGWSQLMRRGSLKPPTSIPGYEQDTELHRAWQ